MAGVAVVTDSTASLGAEHRQNARLTVIPLQVVIDEVSRPEDENGVTPAVVARALRDGRSVTTSRPTPEAFSAAYGELAAAGYDSVVSVHMSSVMSGTFAAAAIAAETSPIPVTVVDSGTLAMAMGFSVLTAVFAASCGRDPAEVADAAQRRAAGGTTYFLVHSLEYLRRGGRIGPAAALLGSALSIKPLLTIKGGEIRPYERVRTASKALARLEELGMAALANATGVSDHVDMAVHHLDNLAGAEALAERLRGRAQTSLDVTVAEVSAVLGAHVGPGTLGVVVSPRL